MPETTTSHEQYLQSKALVLWLDQVCLSNVPLVGGKNASLGEMIQHLLPQGVNVPMGFATKASAYRYFLQSTGLEAKLRQIFADLDVEDVNNLRQRGKKVRRNGTVPC